MKRFFDKTRRAENGCLEWTAAKDNAGYGMFSINGRPQRAHHVAWYFQYGEWSVRTLCHKCDNRACCDPDHLFEGTQRDNMLDAWKKGRMKGRRKFSEDMYQQVRQLIAEGVPQQEIARRFGMSEPTVTRIKQLAKS